MTETPEKNNSQDTEEDSENIIIEIFKRLLEINFSTYGGKKDILK